MAGLDFPWPVTDDELILSNALTKVVAAYDARGENEQSWIEEVAGNLIIEAYNDGLRDEDELARYAIKALRSRRNQ